MLRCDPRPFAAPLAPTHARRSGTMHERRLQPRFPALVKATADVDGVRIPVTCIDIGPGGAYFTGRIEPVAGRQLDFNVRPPGQNSPAVTLSATVVYVLGPGHARPPGFGVRWDVAVSRVGAEPLGRVLHQMLRVPENVETDRRAGVIRFDFRPLHAPAPQPGKHASQPLPAPPRESVPASTLQPSQSASVLEGPASGAARAPDPAPAQRATQVRSPGQFVEHTVPGVSDDIARGPSRYERRAPDLKSVRDPPPRPSATRAPVSMPMASAQAAPLAPFSAIGNAHNSPTPVATAADWPDQRLQPRVDSERKPLDLGPLLGKTAAPAPIDPDAKVPRVALVPGPTIDQSVPPPKPAEKRARGDSPDQHEEAVVSRHELTRVDVWPPGVPRALAERYEQLEQLGEGGNGVVYLAHDKLLDRTVVLKFMAPGSVARPLARKYFLREFRVSTRLNHPNIVKIYDVGSTDGVLYYSMEFLNGDTLGAHLAGGRILAEPEFLYSVMSQLCEALDYAHSQNVLHRDVKPNNVVVLRDGTVKLLDFGLARVQEEGSSEQSLVVGTPHYMAPEQQMRGHIDYRTDIYALGVVLYRMLAGRLPFMDGNVLIAHAVEAVPDPRQFNPDLSPALVAVLMRMLAKQPGDRHPNCTAVALELHVALFGRTTG